MVKDLRTGEPMAGVSCHWMIGNSGSIRLVATDATGSFSFGVPAGTIQVECFGGRMPVVVVREVAVDIQPGATAHIAIDVVEMRRRPSGTIGVGLEDVPPGSHRIDSLRGGAASSGLRVGDVLLAVDGLLGHRTAPTWCTS